MNIEQLENRLAIVKSAQKRTQDIYADLGTEAGSVNLAARINKPFLSLAPTGDDNVDFLNTIRVATIRQRIQEKSFPILSKYESSFKQALAEIREKEFGRLEEKLSILEKLRAYIPEDIFRTREQALWHSMSMLIPADSVQTKEPAVVQAQKTDQAAEPKKDKAKTGSILDYSPLQLGMLEILEIGSRENPLTRKQILDFLANKGHHVNPNEDTARVSFKDALERLEGALERHNDPRRIQKRILSDSFRSNGYFLEGEVVVEQNGMAAEGNIDFKAEEATEIQKESVLLVDEQTKIVSCGEEKVTIEDPVLFEIFKALAQKSGEKVSIRVCEEVIKRIGYIKKGKHINTIARDALNSLEDLLVTLGLEEPLTRLGNPKSMFIALNVSARFKDEEETAFEKVVEKKKSLTEMELLPSRAQSLLLFLDKTDFTMDDLGAILGPVQKGNRKGKPLLPQQVKRSISNSLQLLSDKRRLNVPYTEEENQFLAKVKRHAGTIDTAKAIGVLRAAIASWYRDQPKKEK
ncbi:MAG: hypothetical protein WCV81_05895 [Microgenomates group bacterium]|jgi:hypothetical protein